MEQLKKKRSRDAARQRRGQQNGEFEELASQLPLSKEMSERLDRLCAMRLSNSFIKIKHVLQQIQGKSSQNKDYGNIFNRKLTHALGGFVFVLTVEGQCLYISQNVKDSLGLQPLDIMGDSFYKYVHACDQANLAEQIGGQVPLEDMEIFDGLFCSEDILHLVKKPIQKISRNLENTQYRSFFLRMKSTLTSRGKSVNINASTYRVVHCTGAVKTYRTKLGSSDGSLTRCLLAIGNPLLTAASIEEPIDRQTFVSKHTLDMKVFEIDAMVTEILGFEREALVDSSWYNFVHMCDSNIIRVCHETLLKQGQAVSGYYRLLLQHGGWLWAQSKANVVYLESTGQPQYILCVHYVISGGEAEDTVLSTEQMSRTCKRKSNHYKEIIVQPSDIGDTPPPAKKITFVDAQSPCNTSEESVDDCDIPDLEFLDYDDVGVNEIPEDIVHGRSPFLPSPMADAEIKSEEAKSLLKRAPHIPVSCIETRLTFCKRRADNIAPSLLTRLFEIRD